MTAIDTSETTFKCLDCHSINSFSTTDVLKTSLKYNTTVDSECPSCGATIGYFNSEIH